MKRLVCFMVAAAMLLSLAACAPTTQPNNPENTNAGNTNDPAQPGDTTVTPADGEVSGDYLVWNIGVESKSFDPQINTSARAATSYSIFMTALCATPWTE